MSTPSLRPLSTGELLDRTFSLYRRHFVLFAGIVALTQLPLVALQLAGLALGADLAAGGLGCVGQILWMLVLFVAALAVTAASQGATVVAVSNVHLGRPITIGGALGRIRPRIASLAVTMVVLGIGAALGFLLLVVPGLILTLMWSLAIPVAVLEERSMLDAASRSTELTKGSRMRVALVYGLFALVVFLVSGVMSIPLMVGAFASGSIAPPAPMPAWLQVGNIVTSYLSQCLAAPLMTIGLALLYYDQRVRKEAFDVELMMAALDGQPADYTA